MTLSRKIFLRNIALLAGVVMLGGAAVIGLWRLRDQVDVALDEYAELRLLSTAEARALEAAGGLSLQDANRAHVAEALSRSADALTQYLALQLEATEGSAEHEERETQHASLAASKLRTSVAKLRRSEPDVPLSATERSDVASDVRLALRQVQELTRDSDRLVARTGRRATQGVRVTLVAVSATCLLIIASTIAIGVMQHRGMIRPLREFEEGVRSIAAGRFSQRLAPKGDREFARLAEEFNGMAAELDGLYRSLEEKVAATSRELVQSERLASVGFLAAGVAHEINNPLHIISGYAELSLKQLEGLRPDAGVPPEPATLLSIAADAEQTLRIIREESFRCKGITEKLLSLAHPGCDPREHQTISVAKAAKDVVEIVRAHQLSRDRKVTLRIDGDDPLLVRGSEPEIKQVLLNLVINAMQAVDPVIGRVTVEGNHENGSVRLRVSDNGRGMQPSVLEHVFEPFFSRKSEGPGPSKGLGLGLSISHAIVESHGGKLVAESSGVPGSGSCFTLRLPAAANLSVVQGRLSGLALSEERACLSQL